jgi:hypothetical protein
VLRAAGETETTQENIQDWLELDGAFDRGRHFCSDIFGLFPSALPILLSFPFICFLFFCLVGLCFTSLIPIIA